MRDDTADAFAYGAHAFTQRGAPIVVINDPQVRPWRLCAEEGPHGWCVVWARWVSSDWRGWRREVRTCAASHFLFWEEHHAAALAAMAPITVRRRPPG